MLIAGPRGEIRCYRPRGGEKLALADFGLVLPRSPAPDAGIEAPDGGDAEVEETEEGEEEEVEEEEEIEADEAAEEGEDFGTGFGGR